MDDAGSSAARCPTQTVRKLALWLAIGCALFTVLTYHILFGAVVSPLHSRTNFHRHNIAHVGAAALPPTAA